MLYFMSRPCCFALQLFCLAPCHPCPSPQWDLLVLFTASVLVPLATMLVCPDARTPIRFSALVAGPALVLLLKLPDT